MPNNLLAHRWQLNRSPKSPGFVGGFSLWTDMSTAHRRGLCETCDWLCQEPTQQTGQIAMVGLRINPCAVGANNELWGGPCLRQGGILLAAMVMLAWQSHPATFSSFVGVQWPKNKAGHGISDQWRHTANEGPRGGKATATSGLSFTQGGL